MINTKHRLLLFLTLMLSGRAMTLAFIGRAGGFAPGDPPAAWLMPLMGDALIGISALAIAYLIWKRVDLFTWTAVIVWNAIAIWDALAAFLIHQTVPWPSFFMIQTFGPSMFFVTAMIHLLCIFLIARPEVRRHFLKR